MTEGFGGREEELFYSSDLACERRRVDTDIPGVDFRRESAGNFSWERIRIFSEDGARSIGRPCGSYDTLTLPRMDTLTETQIEDAAEEVAKELCYLCDRALVSPQKLLIVGLGNRELTPDSVGPKCADRVNATMHIKRFDNGAFGELEFSQIAVITPGVMASSGMEAAETVIAVCDRVEPDAVFVIDALASRSACRLGRTVQISDTGIFPGSGIGNSRMPINKKTLGVPVIAIGVPTVISAEVFLLGDTPPDRRDALRARIRRRDICDMFVSPREIDGIIDSSSRVISMGINQAFGIGVL